jgi:hypothetical protein
MSGFYRRGYPLADRGQLATVREIASARLKVLRVNPAGKVPN